MFTKRRAIAIAAAIATVGIGVTAWSATAQSPAAAPKAPDRGVYTVTGAHTVQDRTQVVNSGVDVLEEGANGGAMSVVANPAQADALRERGLTLKLTGDFKAMLEKRSGGAAAKKAFSVKDFPPGDEAYHTYDEMVAELQKTATDHADITELSSIGKSFEGRDIPVLKIASAAAASSPEVLFTCNIHAREHLTTEMCLHIIQRFTEGYATDPNIKNFVDTRQIYVVPSMNPDGSTFDISGGQYQGWRKNRQPNSDGTVGTDGNRNFAYKWGCCGGSDDNPSGETYRGPSAASAPEVAALQTWVDAHQIKVHIDFHSFSELVLWPFGHTNDTVTEGMTQAEYDHFVDIGKQMAATNQYTPEQSSGLYITDGDMNDWMWGQHKILSYCFEMFPSSGGLDGFYPPGSQIGPQTTRNDPAVDILLKNAG